LAHCVGNRISVDTSQMGELLESHFLNDSENRKNLAIPLPDDERTLVASSLHGSNRTEFCVGIISDKNELVPGTRILHHCVQAYSIWQQKTLGRKNQVELTILATAIDLVSLVQKQKDLDSAIAAAVNALAVRGVGLAHFDCVSIGLWKNNNVKLAGISGQHQPDTQSELIELHQNAIQEAILRSTPSYYPAPESQNDAMQLAMAELARHTASEVLVSGPLINESGQTIGGWVFLGSHRDLMSSEFSKWIHVASPMVAESIDLVNRNQKNYLSRKLGRLAQKVTAKVSLIAIVLAIMATGLFMLPVPHRIRCHGTIEPLKHQFAVAPFDGQIADTFVQLGVQVDQGQPLAQFDSTKIDLELNEIESQLEKTSRQRQVELASRNVAKTLQSELETRKLLSRKKLLDYQKDNLNIISPMSGIVLSNAIENAKAASVSLGQPLFDIGTLSPIVVNVSVPSEQICHIRLGYATSVWVKGFDEPQTGKITRISPRSQILDSKNVFIAEIELNNDRLILRPGMDAKIKIECGQKSLGWSLFHRPLQMIRSQILW
ncbi:MAG: efflux RND transporter periplasmic adaptor subunit, partial [Planctomycetota bacterium]